MLDLIQLIAVILGVGYLIIIYAFKFLRIIFFKREFNKEIESLMKKISKEKYIQKIEEINNRENKLPRDHVSNSILFPIIQSFKKSYKITNKNIKGVLYLHFQNFFVSTLDDIERFTRISKNSLESRILIGRKNFEKLSDFYLENKKFINEYLYINGEDGPYNEVHFCLNKDLKNINKIQKHTLDQIYLYLVKKINDPDPYYR